MTDHWVFDPGTERTRIHISGTDGDWRAGIDFVVPLAGPGRYEADASYKGIDRSFAVALANDRTGQRVALIGVEATIELEPNPEAPQRMQGTFSGRFAVGERTTGTDILPRPPAERTYATIRNGRFRLRFRDTLHGKGRLWPTAPRS